MAAVSTPNQAATDKASIPEQLAACRAACIARNWPIVTEIVIPGHSRNYNWLDELVADCPEYGAITRSIRSGDISLILVRDYDRLWRTDALRAQVMALCREHQVQVYALNQPVEPTEPDKLKHATSDSAMILEAIGGVIAESENKARIRRSRSGKEAVIRSGLTQYSNHPPYVYRKTLGSNLIEVNPSEAAWVRWIYEHRVFDRWGLKRISSELNRLAIPAPMGGSKGWSTTTIRNILKNPIYKGATRWGAAYCEDGQHEAIITPELWQQAQVRMPTTEHFSALSAQRGHLLLTGLCRCGYCGYAMSYANGNPGRVLRCSYYERLGKSVCRSNSNNVAEVEAYVLHSVTSALADPTAFLAHQASQVDSTAAADELAAIDRELADIAARYGRWSQLFEAGGITSDELLGHRHRIHTRSDELKRQRETITNTALANSARTDTIYALAENLSNLASMSIVDLKAVYRRMIDRIGLKRNETPVISYL